MWVAPHDRGPIDHTRPGRFFGPDPHYYGYRVHSLPPHYTIHTHWGHRYYYCDGIYYRYYDGCYFVCRPPYGYWFERDLYHFAPHPCHFSYYWYGYHQYDIINDNYRTIQRQNEIIAQNNALIARQNAMTSTYNNYAAAANDSYTLAKRLGLFQSYAYADATYYYDDGVFFIVNSRGQYETILPPAGAIVESLPEDYSIITLADGQQYYKVDYTVYRVVVVEGRAYFEVLGQLQRD